MKSITLSALAIMSVALGFQTLASASPNNKCCYCEIGNYPENQRGFFKTGCDIWLAGQSNCSVKETVNQNTRYEDIDLACKNGGELVVGYVGHWSSASETVSYLSNTIVPAMKKQNVSVTVDNTACFSMDNAEAVFSYVKSLNLPANQVLNVKGNQAESVGEWTVVLGSSLNFSATAASNKDSVGYPACKKYQDYSCLSIQENQSGICLDKNNQPQQLTCCTVQENSYADNSNSNSSRTKLAWTTKDQCLRN